MVVEPCATLCVGECMRVSLCVLWLSNCRWSCLHSGPMAEWRIERTETGSHQCPTGGHLFYQQQFFWSFFFQLAESSLYGLAGTLSILPTCSFAGLPAPSLLATLWIPSRHTHTYVLTHSKHSELFHQVRLWTWLLTLHCPSIRACFYTSAKSAWQSM